MAVKWNEIPFRDPDTVEMFPTLVPEVVNHNTMSWMMAMMAEAKKRANEGETFSVTDLMDAVGQPPGHFNKIGSTMNWIRTVLELKEVGRKRTNSAKGHGRKISIWGRSTMSK